jgi:hypothetical protein
MITHILATFFRLGIAGTCLATPVLAAAAPAPQAESAARLVQSSGFDAMLRHDAQLDSRLRERLPPSLPPELRAEFDRALDHAVQYAEGRRAVVAEISTRLDVAAIDRGLRWWASKSGQAVSNAQASAFREMTAAVPPTQPPAVAPASAPRVDSPFAQRLDALVAESIGVRECLGLTVELRRECADAAAPGAVGDARRAAEVLSASYAKVPASDLAAYAVYLNSPGAKAIEFALADAYRKVRAMKSAGLRKSVGAAVERFARGKVGGGGDEALRKVIALVDDGRSLEEARMILHFLRSAMPRDPRVPVELARVALKRAPSQFVRMGLPSVVYPEGLADAQSWIDIALALEPRRADTLVLAGHLAYLQGDFPRSISLLEQARRIGTANPWLAVNLADALWASARTGDRDRALLARAAQEYEGALAKGVPPRSRWHVVQSLAYLYGDLEDYAMARVRFQGLIAMADEYQKADVQAEYAAFLYNFAQDVDGAIAVGREAAASGHNGYNYAMVANAMLVKAGGLYARGKPADALALVREAQRIEPGLDEGYAQLARRTYTLPAIFALCESRVVRDLSSSEGGLALVLASETATARDIERLVAKGADPNYLDADDGTPLHAAVRSDNVAAVRALLKLGANPRAPGPDGQSVLDRVRDTHVTPSAKGAEIVALLRAGTPGGREAAVVGEPLKPGYVYRVIKKVGSSRYGFQLDAGTRVRYVRTCGYTDPALACLFFEDPARAGGGQDVAMTKEQLVLWQEWFEEQGTR